MNDEPLSRGARALLEQALAEERVLSPDRHHRQRVKRAVQGAVLAGAGSIATAQAASALSLLAVGKSVGLGLLVSGAVLGGAQLLSAPPSTSRPASSALSSAPRRAEPLPAAAPLGAATAGDEAASAKPVDVPAPKIAVSSAPVQAPSGTPALRAELELLNAAQSALRQGRPGETLSLLERYDTAFPGGQLVSERLAVEVFAACDLGDRARATRAASRFLQRDGNSALAERVKRACPFQPAGDAP